MKTKYVTIPDPIKIRNLVTRKAMDEYETGADGKTRKTGKIVQPYSMYRHLFSFCFNHPKWENGALNHRIQNRVLGLLEDAEDDDRDLVVIAVRGDYHKEVSDFLESDDFVVPSSLASQLIPLTDAWLGAENKDPRKAGAGVDDEPENVDDEPEPKPAAKKRRKRKPNSSARA